MKKKIVTPYLILLIAFFSLSANNLFAQIEQVDRIEIPLSKKNTIDNLYNFGSNGFILSTFERENKSSRSPVRVFSRYNTNLEEKERYEVNVNFRERFVAVYEGKEALFLLYHDVKFKKFSLIQLSSKDLSEKRLEGKFPSKFEVNKMVCYSHYAIVYGSVKGRNKLIVLIDLETGEITTKKLITNARKLTYKYLDLTVSSNENNASALFGICSKKECNEYQLFYFTENGFADSIQFDAGEYEIGNASVKEVSDNNFVIVGNYTKKDKSGSEGLFISQINAETVFYFKTYAFSDFDNFFNHLGSEGKRKMEIRKERRKAHGKDLRILERIALHEIELIEDGYLIIAEFYTPTHHYETRTLSNGTTSSYLVFDGYQYTHAAIASFDKNGDKLYDNSFEMYLYQKPFHVKRFINVGVDGNKISLVFADRNRIKSKIVENGKIVEGESSNAIETNFENDKVRYSGSEMEYWYDNYFVSFGSQRIRNTKDKRVDRKRTVFFVQKVKY